MKVNIDENGKEKLILEYSKSIPKETGRILFGHYPEVLETAIITNIFFKGSNSESYRGNFKRGTKGLNKFSKKMWSQGEFYLRKWCTHPQSLPNMSLQDKQQMITIKNDD